MPDTITIRSAGREDAEVFLDLVDGLADYEELPRPTPEARERLLRDGFGERPFFRAYLAELNGRPVAYAITFLTYSTFLALPTLFLEDLFVLPEARGHGIGRAMFRHLAGEALRDNCGRMEWMVLDWNQLAIDFYERLPARRLKEWYGYRLTREQLEALAGTEAGT
ncbi:MAG: GNAT family N-acetyltransferase [Gemmatimonadaceae bacterium]